MTHLESLTKKLHALLPELTELTRGCVFTYKDELMVYIGRSRHGFVQAIHSDCFLWDTATQKDPEELVKEFKILGHPITLNEIIEVLPEEYGYSKTKGFVKFHKEPRQHYTRMAIYWAKGLPLHKQSPELHEFLDDLLPAHMSEPQKHD